MSDSSERFTLFVIILNQPDLLDDLLTGFLDVGVQGATVLESRGMGQIIRQEMPIFAGLAGMFGENTGSRVIFSVMPTALVESVFKLVDEVAQQVNSPGAAVCFTLGVDQFRLPSR
jgi:nitrogen regulatory protein PII